MRILWISAIVLLSFAFSGCTASQAVDLPPSDPLEAPAQEENGESIEMSPTIPAESGLENLIERAKTDLAQRLNIVLSQIDLIDAKAVVWPDASLGCPQPGMLYKQVPADGALVVLQVDGITYEYHNGGTRGLFLCEKSKEKPSPPPQIDFFNLTPSSSGGTNPGAPTPDNSIPPGEDQ
jgi:hypothetical protein